MKLNGANMLNIEMVAKEWRKPDFDFQDIWNNIEYGTFLQFEETVKKECTQYTGSGKETVSYRIVTEIVECLQMLPRGGEATEPAFLIDGRLDRNALLDVLEPLKDNSFFAQMYFVQRNEHTLDELIGAVSTQCSVRQAYTLYLFLLLQLQCLPKEKIREQDAAFILQLLTEDSSGPAPFEARPSRMCLCNGMVLRCIGKEISCNKLRGGGWTSFYRDEEEIAGFAYTEELGLIAFTVGGKLCDCTATGIRKAAEGKRIVMASAYGRQYILLAEDGTVVSSLPIGDSAIWQKVSWVHMGLNSASGISGLQNSAIQHGSEMNTDYTDVKTVVTRSSDGKKRYAVLTNDGVLNFDQGKGVEDVTEVCMGIRGYVYVRDGSVYLREYGSEEDRCAGQLPAELEVAELHTQDELVLCGTAEKPYILPLS